MAGYPPPYTPPPQGDWRYQRRMMRDQAKLQQEYLRAQRQAYRQQWRARSRGSIVGPLLVVAVGLVFLLVQLGRVSTVSAWRWYGHWWPLLLVGVGAVLLLEWALDQFGQDKTGPRRSIGSGVVFLLIIMSLVGLAFSPALHAGHGPFGQEFALNSDNLNEFLGDKHESEQAFVETLDPGGTLTVQNPRGDLTVSGTSDDGKVHLQLHREIYSRSDTEASSQAERMIPNISHQGGALAISLPVMDGARGDLTLVVPPGAAETLTADHGDIRVSSVKAPVTLVANHGDVDISAVTGTVTTHINHSDSSFSAHSITGPLTVAGRGHDLTLSDITGAVTLGGDFFGTAHLERIAGNVTFHTSRTDLQLGRVAGEVDISPNADLSATEIAGPVVLNTRNRNITLDRVSGDLTVTNRNGSVDLTSASPLGNVVVENQKGSVSLTLPASAGFVLQANTTDGDLENEFSLPVREEDNRKSVQGSVGPSGPNVRVTTTDGDISVKRGNAAPLPPAPPPPPQLSAAPKIQRQAAVATAEALRQAHQQIRAAQAGIAGNKHTNKSSAADDDTDQ